MRWSPSGAETRSTALCGLAVIEPEQAAEPLTTFDRTCSDHRCLGREQFVAQTLMRTFFMIMIDERADRRSEVRFAEEHHSIQTL